jgi:hypothetical protein
MRVGFPVCLACGVVLLAGCNFSFSIGGSKAIKRSALEQQISDRLTAQVGKRPKAIVCPGDLKGKQGTTMRCQLEAGDGTKLGVAVTVTSVKGNFINYSIQVDSKP